MSDFQISSTSWSITNTTRWASFHQKSRHRFASYWLEYLQEHRTNWNTLNEDKENVRAAWIGAVVQSKYDLLEQNVENLFDFYLSQSLFQEGLDLFDQTVSILWPDENSIATSHNLIYWRLHAYRAVLHLRLGNYQIAREKLEESLQQFRQMQQHKEEVACLVELAGLIKIQGEFTEKAAQKASYLLETALEKAEKLPSSYLKGRCLYESGSIYLNMRHYEKSKDFFTEALHLFRDSNNRINEGKTVNALGVIANFQGRYEDAKQHYEQSQLICKETGSRRGEGIAASNIGYILYLLGDFENAKPYYTHSIEIANEIGDRRLLGIFLVRLGQLYCQLGKYKRAEQVKREALVIGKDIASIYIQRMALNHLGQCFIQAGNLAKANRYFQQSLALPEDPAQNLQVLEGRAGFAQVQLELKNIPHAIQQVEIILPQIRQPIWPLDFSLYLTSYRVLEATKDPRAYPLLVIAYNLLQEQAAKIRDPKLKASYLNNIPIHQTIQQLHSAC